MSNYPPLSLKTKHASTPKSPAQQILIPGA